MNTSYLATLNQSLTDAQKSIVLNNLGIVLPEKVQEENKSLNFKTSGSDYIGTVGNLNVAMRFGQPAAGSADSMSRVGLLYLSTVTGTMDVIIDYKTYKLNAVSGYSDVLKNGVAGMKVSTTVSQVASVEVCSCVTDESIDYYVKAQGGIAEVNICDGTDVYHIYIKASSVNKGANKGTFDVTITK